MRHSLAFFFLTALAAVSSAQMTPVSATGYNQDVIANGYNPTDSQLTRIQNSTNATIDGQFNLFSTNFVSASSVYGLPSDRTFTSYTTPTTTFQLQSYSANNVLLLHTADYVAANGGSSSGTLTLGSAARYSSLSFLFAGYNGNVPATYQLNYADGTTSTGSFTAWDNFNVTNNVVLTGFGRVYTAGGGGTLTYTDNPRFYELNVTPTSTKTLASITFANTGTSANASSQVNVGVYGISGTVVPVPEPAAFVALGMGALALVRRRR